MGYTKEDILITANVEVPKEVSHVFFREIVTDMVYYKVWIILVNISCYFDKSSYKQFKTKKLLTISAWGCPSSGADYISAWGWYSNNNQNNLHI